MASNEESFFSAQQQAIERMKEMSSRATINETSHPTPPMPSFVRLNQQPRSTAAASSTTQLDSLFADSPHPDSVPKEAHPPTPTQNPPGGALFSSAKDALSGVLDSLHLPFLSKAKGDRDLLLILGLGYLLWNDSSDWLLLLALLYILL
ncbi:MAG: hypothetical protein IKI29_02775 [Clostridia bacterium]|nr:hypothetical protein [Clostridia bacterium]